MLVVVFKVVDAQRCALFSNTGISTSEGGLTKCDFDPPATGLLTKLMRLRLLENNPHVHSIEKWSAMDTSTGGQCLLNIYVREHFEKLDLDKMFYVTK